jgi:prepilin-type N-terminal cleavage/methylation domain-containing protein
MTRTTRGFTLIELLTVIAIMMLIMALAMPNFVAMAKQRKWTSSVSDMQGLIWRARALATNVRKEMSVEFDIRDSVDNGTRMWVESESNLVERLPEMSTLVAQVGPFGVAWILGWWNGEFFNAGGDWNGDQWKGYSDFRWDPQNALPDPYGDNAFQSESIMSLAKGLTIDAKLGQGAFINWDDRGSVKYYGYDKPVTRMGVLLNSIRDIRIATNGALAQSTDPIISIKQVNGTDRKTVSVVRCTGRMITAQ